MKIADVVNQLSVILPEYTSLFGDVLGISSIEASGGTATVVTSSDHNFITGQAVTMAGVETRTPITGVSQNGLVFAFTSNEHDLTENWPEQEEIELGGFTDTNWNEEFDLVSANNRYTFQVRSSNTIPILTGSEYLLETDRTDGLNGKYSVTVVNGTTFTISGDFSDGAYTPVNGKVYARPRVASVVNVDRALEEYTKQSVNDFWCFVEPVDAAVSKDRSTYSDAIATIGGGEEYRTRIIDGFNVYIFAPCSNEISGEDAVDICRHDLLLPMMRSLYGVEFDTGLYNDADFRTILRGHRVAAYDGAYLTYVYEFEFVMDLTDDDTVLPKNTRAFRNINYTQEVGDTDTTDMTITALNLDDNPV